MGNIIYILLIINHTEYYEIKNCCCKKYNNIIHCFYDNMYLCNNMLKYNPFSYTCYVPSNGNCYDNLEFTIIPICPTVIMIFSIFIVSVNFYIIINDPSSLKIIPKKKTHLKSR